MSKIGPLFEKIRQGRMDYFIHDLLKIRLVETITAYWPQSCCIRLLGFLANAPLVMRKLILGHF
jgi:hypothetical protein